MILLRNIVIWDDLNFKAGCVKGFWKQSDMLGMVAYACDTSTWEMELEGQEFKVTVSSMGVTIRSCLGSWKRLQTQILSSVETMKDYGDF